jgi:hypothetical protein
VWLIILYTHFGKAGELIDGRFPIRNPIPRIGGGARKAVELIDGRFAIYKNRRCWGAGFTEMGVLVKR